MNYLYANAFSIWEIRVGKRKTVHIIFTYFSLTDLNFLAKYTTFPIIRDRVPGIYIKS